MTDPNLMELRLILHSIHNVMLAEELLLKIGVPIDMIPVPREISSDCGMCLACHLKDLDKIRASFENEPFTSSIMIYEKREPKRKVKTLDWKRNTTDRKFKLLLTLP